MAALLRIGQAHHLHGCLILAEFSHFLPPKNVQLNWEMLLLSQIFTVSFWKNTSSTGTYLKQHIVVKVQLFSHRLPTHLILNTSVIETFVMYLYIQHRDANPLPPMMAVLCAGKIHAVPSGQELGVPKSFEKGNKGCKWLHEWYSSQPTQSTVLRTDCHMIDKQIPGMEYLGFTKAIQFLMLLHSKMRPKTHLELRLSPWMIQKKPLSSWLVNLPPLTYHPPPARGISV